MRIEIVVNENGKIIAAVQEKGPLPSRASESGGSKPSAMPMLHAGPGRQRHVFALSDELAAMSLKEVLRTYRFVSDHQGPRLERK
jgi:hypothetical protein